MRRLSKDPWVITIGGTVLAVLFLRLIDWFFIDNLLWDSIKKGLSAVVGFFGTEYTVKLYFLGLLPLLGMILFGGLIFSYRLRRAEAIINIPEWADYTRDVFGGIQYRWQYDTRSGEYEIAGIRPYCNDCSCQIVNQVCPNCKNDFGWEIEDTPNIKSNEDIRALAWRNIETGDYKVSMLQWI